MYLYDINTHTKHTEPNKLLICKVDVLMMGKKSTSNFAGNQPVFCIGWTGSFTVCLLCVLLKKVKLLDS